ncbi:RHS repeat domain-containing protein [Thiovibrio sp. JS02]
MEQKGRTFFYHADGLGSIVSLTDAKNHVVQSYEYDSFGNMQHHGDEVKQPYAYTAREWDQETGLYFYRARYYDPQVGRFISKDPIGFAGGINVYAYVSNNGVTLNDPFGLCAAATTTDCSYYDIAYAKTGCEYYKDAKNWCERFGALDGNTSTAGWTQCVRRCLQISDMQKCRPEENTCVDCDAVKSCNGDNHQFCYTACRYADQSSTNPNKLPELLSVSEKEWIDNLIDWGFNGPIGDFVNWLSFY